MIRVAVFISPHGFGHAARAAATLQTLRRRIPDLELDLYTLVPEWFFTESLDVPFRYHPERTDIGLVQTTPLVEDLPATCDRLAEFIPFSDFRLDVLAARLRESSCRIALCDISPLGIAAAHRAGIPSVLMENFTWDWIYAGYFDEEPRLSLPASRFGELFASASYHIQCAPVCRPHPGADLTVDPVSRQPLKGREAIRERLGILLDAPAALITMGGIRQSFGFLDRLHDLESWYFIIPGGAESTSAVERLRLLPHHSTFFHPDLVSACDLLIGKAGYSTVAEAYHAGIPFGYVSRPRFRESETLGAFIRREMHGLEIQPEEFEAGSWVDEIPRLGSAPRRSPPRSSGAEQAADFLASLLL